MPDAPEDDAGGSRKMGSGKNGAGLPPVHIAREEVLSPAAPEPHVLVAFNAPSLAKFGPKVRPGGIVIYDSSVIAEAPGINHGTRVIGIPLTEIALELGNVLVKNIVAQAENRFPSDTCLPLQSPRRTPAPGLFFRLFLILCGLSRIQRACRQRGFAAAVMDESP